MLGHCEGEARAAGFRRTELMATMPGVPFYRAAGYAALEEVAFRMPDGTIVDFVRMGREL